MTRNALIALYFACNNHFSKNGWVFFFDEKEFLPRSEFQENLQFTDIHHPHVETFLELFESFEIKGKNRGIKREITPEMPHLFKPKQYVKYRILYKRILEQSGEFIWWHPISPFNRVKDKMRWRYLPQRDQPNKIKLKFERPYDIS